MGLILAQGVATGKASALPGRCESGRILCYTELRARFSGPVNPREVLLIRAIDCPANLRVPTWVAALFFLLLALVVTWPLALHLRSLVVGDQQGDMWKHLWGFWWMKEELLDHHRLPIWTQLLNYPYGGNLFFIDPLNALLSFPLQLAGGVVFSYNVLVILNLFLGGLGAYLLARYLTGNSLTALAAGTIYGFCSYMLCYIASGVTEAINTGWIPLYLYALFRTLETRKLLWALTAGYLLFLCAFGCWYYGIFMVFFTLIILAERAWSALELTRRLGGLFGALGKGPARTVFGPPLAGLGSASLGLLRGRTLRMLLVTGLVGSALTFPVYLQFSKTINNPHSLVYRERGRQQSASILSESFYNVGLLSDYVLPGKSNIIRSYTVDRLWRSPYVGYATLLLALAAAWGFRKEWYFRFWAICGVVFALFSLGPFMYITSNLHLPLTFPSPLYMLLYDHLPFFSKVAIPYRFNLLFMLSAGMLVAGGLARWLRPLPAPQQVLAVLVTCLALFFELLLVSPAPFPLPMSTLGVPEFYRGLARDNRDYGVIDLPFQRVKGELLPGEYFYYQMVHHKNIPNKVEGTIAVYVFQNPFLVHLFNLEHGYTRVEPSESDCLTAIADLRKNKFKYLMVHDNLMFPDSRERVHQVLRYFFGPPQVFPDGVRVYGVEAPASAPAKAGKT